MKKPVMSAALIMLFLSTPQAAYAEAIPPLGTVERILWAVRCAGDMPPLMIGALAAAGVLTAISFLGYRQVKKRHER